MKPFFIGLSIVAMTMSTALAQTDPNAPTGPFNPNPPAQFAGQQVPLPCGLAANQSSNSASTPSPTASAGQPQRPTTEGDRQAGAAKDNPSAGAGCAGQDHPGGGSSPAPANAPHP